MEMASRCIEDVLPSLVRAIEKNIRWHWNRSVQTLTVSVKKMLEELEPSLYSKCLEDLDFQETMAEQQQKKRREMWEKLERAAPNRNFLQPSTNCTCVSHLDIKV